MDFTAALPTFIVTLREGFEAALVVGIVMACLKKAEQTQLYRWVYLGIGGGIIASIAVGFLLAGAIAGLTLAAIMGVALFSLGVRINIRLFFQVMGIFLLLIVGGLVMGALQHFDTALALLSQVSSNNLCISDSGACILGNQIWDGSSLLPDQKFPGIVLKALFGYRQTLYLGQIIAYLAFLGIIGTAYFQSLTGFALKAEGRRLGSR